MLPVAVLVATKRREVLLRERALLSVASQTIRPAIVVIVNDGPSLGRATKERARSASAPGTTVVLDNDRMPGAAGAWNAGLAYLAAHAHPGYVAMLDDDDEWDPDHLEVNARASLDVDADLSVSGLRIRLDGVDRPRPLIAELRATDFLSGNPGWQGSNTFAKLSLLLAVGGFRDGLASLNDRDLAVRLLRRPGVRTTLVPRWSATWHVGRIGGLSSPGSPAKLDGLAAFWRVYGRSMTAVEADRFFERALVLFHFDRRSIVGHNVALASHDEHRGSLHV